MKIHYLPFLLVFCLYACSSPNTKKAVAAQPKQIDSTADTSSSNPLVEGINFSLRNDEITEPPYGLEKVKALIAGIKSEDDTTGSGDGIEALNEKDYSSLSFREKFTYHMIHPETYSQMCDALPGRSDEAHRIYGHLPDIFGEYDWSKRQLDFFKDNKDSVQQLMKPLIEKTGTVGANFKEAIVEMNGKEMIPFLIAAYNKDKKDHYILTVLMLLMKASEYPEFMNSVSYIKLYHKETGEYSAYLKYNKANEDLIIQRATNFYNGSSAK